jgi:serine phosphatase RsbU (regulator of sigma subunit)
MRLGTKILLLMLVITIGSSAIVAWIVSRTLTNYETDRANDQISRAITRYLRHLDERHEQISRVVRAMLEAPAQRSLLQAADDPADKVAREQLKQEVFGRDVQTELQSGEGTPAFHVLANAANELLLVSAGDAKLAPQLTFEKVKWPVDAVIHSGAKPVMQYVSTPGGLFLAMGVPLRTQLNESPTHAYFVGFRVDDFWVRQQLLADRTTAASTGAPLEAWFVVGGRIAAEGSSNEVDPMVAAFRADTVLRPSRRKSATTGASVDYVEFDAGGERFLGQSFPLDNANPQMGRLVLASSLDQALAPLRRLQRQLLMTTLLACGVAVLVCRFIARMISKPIDELVAGTRRIAAGHFDSPVHVRREDELGALAESFNQMSQGLKERDGLLEERTKIQRDLALARQIQMDVLPKQLPPTPGYDMAAYSLPAEQTGGDIYDLVALALEPPNPEDPPSVVLLLADATGHGIGPALSVTQVRSMLRIGVSLRAGLEDLFGQINRQLCQDLGNERFVTAFMGLLDLDAHRISYHSAGQGPLLHYHTATGEIEWLSSSMLPLGVDADAQSDGVRSMKVAPGDLVVLLTDGFFEYRDPDGEMFGQDRVAQIIRANHTRSAREILSAILQAIHEFARGAPQEDDMTGLVIRRLAKVVPDGAGAVP